MECTDSQLKDESVTFLYHLLNITGQTEEHSVLPPVVSLCQKFHFLRKSCVFVECVEPFFPPENILKVTNAQGGK